MRPGNLLFSAVQFIFVVALFMLSGLFLGLEHAPHVRSAIATFFLEYTGSLTGIGYALLGCACLLLFGFYIMNRGVYYRVEMGVHQATVDPSLIRTYVQEYWNEIFPEKHCATDLILHSRRKIEVVAEMPDLPPDQQKALLLRIEKELGHLLAYHLGYRREFLVTVIVK